MFRDSVARNSRALRRGIHNLPHTTGAVSAPEDALSSARLSISRAQRNHNLSRRYAWLESLLRPEGAVVEDIVDALPPTQRPDASELSKSAPAKSKVETFHGLVIPKEPVEPGPEECCMATCAVCVNDVYDDELKAYDEELVKIRSALTSQGVPESEWPARIRPSGPPGPSAKDLTRDAVLNAFEEMERMLAAKKKARAAAASKSS